MIKKLKNIWTLRLILFVSSIVLAVLGCNKNKDSINTENSVNASTEETFEGIRLYFENIPQLTNKIYINILQFYNDKKPLSVSAIIDNTILEQIKQRGTLICPFINNDMGYYLTIHFWYDLTNYEGYNFNNDNLFTHIEVKANYWVQVSSEIEEYENKGHITKTLSTQPKENNFLTERELNPDKYHSFSISIGEMEKSGYKNEIIKTGSEDNIVNVQWHKIDFN